MWVDDARVKSPQSAPWWRLGCAALLVVPLLAGCTSNTPTPPVDPTAPATTTAGSPTAGPATASSSATTTSTEPLPFGQPFEYAGRTDDGKAAPWSVTLTKTDCGLKTLRRAEANPDWDGSKEFPAFLDAKPRKGNEFCVLNWTWTNNGKAPATVVQSGDLVLGGAPLKRSEDDQFLSWTLMKSQKDVDFADQVKAGKTLRTLEVYQVPAGKKPEAVWFPIKESAEGAARLVATL